MAQLKFNIIDIEVYSIFTAPAPASFSNILVTNNKERATITSSNNLPKQTNHAGHQRCIVKYKTKLNDNIISADKTLKLFM